MRVRKRQVISGLTAIGVFGFGLACYSAVYGVLSAVDAGMNQDLTRSSAFGIGS